MSRWQCQSVHKPNSSHSQATSDRDKLIYFITFFLWKRGRTSQSQPLQTCIDQYYQVHTWLYWYICIVVEIVSICYYMVCSHRDLGTGSGHMNWREGSKLFHQALWNLINGNAFDCTDLCGILQVSWLWWDVLAINNFLSCAVKLKDSFFFFILSYLQKG